MIVKLLPPSVDIHQAVQLRFHLCSLAATAFATDGCTRAEECGIHHSMAEDKQHVGILRPLGLAWVLARAWLAMGQREHVHEESLHKSH